MYGLLNLFTSVVNKYVSAYRQISLCIYIQQAVVIIIYNFVFHYNVCNILKNSNILNAYC